MDIEDELRRVLRDENLDVPVRTGAEWSVMAGARRRRRRHNAMALLGGALAATMLAGSGLALVSYQSDPPPVKTGRPPVVGSSAQHRPELPPHSRRPNDPAPSISSTDEYDYDSYELDYPTSTDESEDNSTLLRESLTSEPDETTSDTQTSSPNDTASNEPSSTSSPKATTENLPG